MKSFTLRSLAGLVLTTSAAALVAQTNIAINNTGVAAHPSAILDVNSLYTPIGSAIQKGMLIPRMTRAQKIGVGTTDQSLLVYQTDNFSAAEPAGFYYVESGAWLKLDIGANNWDIWGNNISSSFNDFLGNRDSRDFNMNANGAVANANGSTFELTLKGLAPRYLGVNTTTPAEMVDVNGAIRIFKNGAAPYSQTTTTPGVILFHPRGSAVAADTIYSNYVPPVSPAQSRDAIMWNGHWGQQGATAVNQATVATDNAYSGTWRKLENDYEERFTKAYTQQGRPTCAAGSIDIPSMPAGGNWSTFPPANMTSSLTPFEASLVNPYANWTGAPAAALRIRHQYMILASELDVENNQLGNNTFGAPAVPTATGGLCKGQPVTSIGIYVGAFTVGVGVGQRSCPAGNFAVTIKHVPFALNNLAAGFDNSIDPAQACYNQVGTVSRPIAPNAWETYTPLSQPFVWDGVRNVVIEFAMALGANATQQPPILFATTPVPNLTASWNSPSAVAPCGSVGLAGSCGPAVAGAGMPWANATCGATGTNGGLTNKRPVFRFTGTVATAPTATSGTNSFIWYRGGMVVESTTPEPPSASPGWGRRVSPSYVFRGPGTISVERGVYDYGVRLNDHVFDRAFDGRVAPADAPEFGGRGHVGIDEMARFTEDNRHLPTMKGRNSWNTEGSFSLGDLTNQLWTTTETQALYVTELNDRLNVLEVLATDRPLQPAEMRTARAHVARMGTITDAEKAALMRTLDERTITTNQR